MIGPYPPFWQYLGSWLTRRGWTQVRLADELGVHQTVVSKWLHSDPRRRTRPSRRAMTQLASILDLPLGELLAMVMTDETLAEQARAQSKAIAPEGKVGDAAAIDELIQDTTAEMRSVLDGVPRIYWATVIKAFRRGVDSARDLAQLLMEAPEPPVSAPREGGLNRPIGALERGDDESNSDLTVRQRRPLLAGLLCSPA